MPYGDFKDLAKRTASDRVLRDKAFNIAEIPKMVDIKEVLFLWFIRFLIKKPLHLQINLCQVVARFLLLCVIDILSKYACVVPLKDKNSVTIVNRFQKFLDDSMELHSKRKSNKIWVDKSSEFHNSSLKKWLKDNDIEMYSTQN